MRRLWLTTLVPIAVLLMGSGKLPPIGQRTYVIDVARPHAPVTIDAASVRNDAGKNRVLLKDPVHPSAPAKAAPAQPRRPKPVQTVQTQPRERPGRMRFGKLSVSGHLRRPRVEFSRDVLPVERADELQTPDFFQKVYEPASDL